jgi:2-polyprenyl-3-methyl-5-hydroxy-6-metoxy-1,4-benzoquinol methylase
LIRPGELAAAGLAPGWIDVAALYHVIEHLRDPRQELRELRRLNPAATLSLRPISNDLVSPARCPLAADHS